MRHKYKALSWMENIAKKILKMRWINRLEEESKSTKRSLKDWWLSLKHTNNKNKEVLVVKTTEGFYKLK